MSIHERLIRIRSINTWAIVFVVIAIFYIFLCFIYPPERHAANVLHLPLVTANPSPTNQVNQTNQFIPGKCLPTPFAYTPKDLAIYGSVANNKNLLGTFYSPWYGVQSHFHLWIAGYPAVPGNRLRVEVQTATKPIKFTVKPRINPGYLFSDQFISLEHIKNAKAFRLVATIGSPAPAGWMCISQPFNWQSDRSGEIREILRVIATFITCLVLLILPGLLLRNILYQSFDYSFPFILVLLPGLALLIGLSILAWWIECATTGTFNSQILMALGSIPLLGYGLFYLRRHPLTSITSLVERRVLLIFSLVALLAVAKGTYSLGPLGELYSGFISRTTEINPLSDSRISYLYAQLIFHGINPFSEMGESYFNPWYFSSRGPLAGLVSSPIVFLSGAHVPTDWPEYPWAVFDPEGFSAYRIAMSILAASSLMVLYGLAEKLIGKQWGLLTVLVGATTPFIVHEVYFTWPKLTAAMFVLLAVYGLLERQLFLSGIVVMIGYLFHPSALLSMPALLALLSWQCVCSFQVEAETSQSRCASFTERRPGRTHKFFCGRDRAAMLTSLRRLALGFTQFFLGIASIYLIWWLVNGQNIQQTKFLHYFYMADGNPYPTTMEWLLSRFTSLKIALIPLYLLGQTTFGVRYLMETVYQTILPPIIPFFLQYWNTLPFGMGITFFPLLILILLLIFLKFRWLFVSVILLPFLVFWLWWGASNAGLLLGGLHAWIFAIILLSMLVVKQHLHRQPIVRRSLKFLLLLRGFEVLALLTLPVWLSIGRVVNDKFLVSDSVMLVLLFAITCYLVLQTYSYTRELCSERAAMLFAADH